MSKEPVFEHLPPGKEFENACMACAWPILLIAQVQWTINTWRAQYRTWVKHGRKGVFVPAMPRKISIDNYLVGWSCAMIAELLKLHGVSCQVGSLAWDVWPNGAGLLLHFDLMVPGPMFDMADALLWQYRGSYYVTSAGGRSRGAKFTQRWGVRAKDRSFDEALTSLLFGWIMGKGLEKWLDKEGKEHTQRLSQMEKQTRLRNQRKRVTEWF